MSEDVAQWLTLLLLGIICGSSTISNLRFNTRLRELELKHAYVQGFHDAVDQEDLLSEEDSDAER